MSTLRARLFVLVAVSVLVATALTVTVTAVVIRHRLDVQREVQLSRQVGALPANQPGLRVYAERAVRPDAGGGTVIVELAPRTAAAIARRVGRARTRGSIPARRGRLLFARRTTRRSTVILVRRARATAHSPFGPYLESILLAGLVGALAAGCVALLLARRIARPLRELTGATRQVAEGRRLDVEAGAHDVQEVRELASAFTTMAHELADARDAQRAFLLSVSHELKTPLTAIRGYAEALEEGAVDARAAAPVITDEAHRLERLVSDLLDLARADRDDFLVRDQAVDLADIVRVVAARHARQAEGVGARFALELDGPAAGRGDADRLTQALSNLVENALRVSPPGGTIVIAAADGRIAVTDSGPGLDAEDLPRAFERFYLHDRYRSDRAVGSGLGLAIVRELMHAMGGEADVVSTPGHGATFSLRTRLPDGAPTPRPAARPDVGPVPTT